MTLIAAYPYQDVPILIGDFLLTGGQQDYTAKKAHLISPNFVVAWTGKRLNAKPILTGLFQAFANRRVSMSEVESFLIKFPQSEFIDGELHLIGWVVDNIPVCFLWRRDWPHEVFYENEHFDGTGGDFYKDLMTIDVMPPTHDSKLPSVQEAVYHSLSRSCMLISAEDLSIDKSWQNGFGFAYEILFYDGQQFRYVPDVLYAMMNYYMDENDNVQRVEFVPKIYKYRNYIDLSLVQIVDIAAKHVHCHFIGPSYYSFDEGQKRGRALLATTTLPLPLESLFYCVLFRFFTRDRPFPIVTVSVLPHLDPNIRVADQGVQSTVAIRNSHAVRMYRRVKEATQR